MKERFFGVLFHGVAALAVMLILVPVALSFFTPGFGGKGLGTVLYVTACVERMWAMYLRQGLNRAISGAGRDWTAVAVGYAYVLTLGGAAVEFLLRGAFSLTGLSVAGAALYGAGVALRYWAFHTLRQQWHVDVSDIGGSRHLVREGVYRFLRHPLYLGACLEVVGLPLFLGAWGALAFGVLAFVPLEIIRAYYEERFLHALFGSAYRQYAEEVWGFFPLPFRPRRRR